MRPLENTSIRDPARRLIRDKLGVPSLLLQLKHDAGWPDVMFLVPGGRPLLMEFKRPGFELEPLQEERRATLLKLGYDAEGPVSSVEEAWGLVCLRLVPDRLKAVK